MTVTSAAPAASATPVGATVSDGSGAHGAASGEVDVDRLRSRLERERRARRQAEVIAERGMRELWETNRELQRRVARRTAELERVAVALEYAQVARLQAIGELIDDLEHDVQHREHRDEHHDRLAIDGGRDAVVAAIAQIRSLVAAPRHPEDLDPCECGVLELADRLIERWQRAAAKRGQLLTVEHGADSEHGTGIGLWTQVLAVADTLLAGIVRSGGTGSVSVLVEPGPDDVSVRFSGPAVASALNGGACSATAETIAPDVALAASIASVVGGVVTCPGDGDDGIVAVIPQSG